MKGERENRMKGATDAALEVQVAAGTVRGVTLPNGRVWLGIPYAASTSGVNRWRAPQPVTSWSGARECTRYGNIAPQPMTPLFPALDSYQQSEDCLNLNVWVPATGATGATGDNHSNPKKLPVMVWIHGGGYVIGTSAQPVYHAERLANQGEVIVVTLNYRLGALGFLNLDFLNTEVSKFETNLGLRDIVAALEWVRANIAQFGGDPEDVTVFGQSAGAASITTLMTMPSTRGLFHKAIAQSPPATSVYGRERARHSANAYLELLNITSLDVAASLRTMDVHQLMAPAVEFLYETAKTTPGILGFSPIVDGDFVPDYPIDVFERGEEHPIPLLIGSTNNEAALFKLMRSPLMPTESSAVERMFEGLRSHEPNHGVHFDRVTPAYPGYPRQSAAIQISSDAGIGMPVTWIADAHARTAPTFVYRFEQSTPLMKLMRLGAVHASELPYVFGNLPKRARLNRRESMWIAGLTTAKKVSERMQAYWTSFARTGSPGWQKYGVSSRLTQVISSRDRLSDDPNQRARNAWGSETISFP